MKHELQDSVLIFDMLNLVSKSKEIELLYIFLITNFSALFFRILYLIENIF